MRPSLALSIYRDDIRRIVESHRATNPRVFGSVIRGEDTNDGDLDIIVDSSQNMTLMNIGGIRRELRKLLGVKVDVLTPMAFPEKWRADVIAEAIPI